MFVEQKEQYKEAVEGLGVFGCNLAVSPSADTRIFCSDADAALWAEDYCDSFKDVQTIGVVFGAFSC